MIAMKQITRRRKELGLNKTQLAREALLHPSRVGVIENGWAVPYPVELTRLAEALEWEGEPGALLEEVDDDARRHP
jgi:predicted transcriptional regulator